ncbi:MAG: urease accessory protein UreF [Methylobacter sp.]|nr:MAG: urease accessory protein UreF [Methylobacter sp.]
MATDPALLRLLQLVSPSLPVGMYSYSQGLETAVAEGWVHDATSARDWLHAVLTRSLARTDAPILLRLMDAWQSDDSAKVLLWSETLAAFRETAELRLEDRQMGLALVRVLEGLGLAEAKAWHRHTSLTFAAMFALAAVRWRISQSEAINGYLWSWLENQVLCAIKLVPLGQAAGQGMLYELAGLIPAQTELALTLGDDDLGGSVFGLALASSRHEMQYSRLFRS